MNGKRGAGDAQVFQTRLDEVVHHLVQAALRLHKERVFLVEFDQPVEKHFILQHRSIIRRTSCTSGIATAPLQQMSWRAIKGCRGLMSCSSHLQCYKREPVYLRIFQKGPQQGGRHALTTERRIHRHIRDTIR